MALATFMLARHRNELGKREDQFGWVDEPASGAIVRLLVAILLITLSFWLVSSS